MLAVLLVLGCILRPAEATEPPVPGAVPLLTVAINTDIRGTNPGVNRDGNTDAVMHQVVEALVAYGEDLQIRPDVAESWSVEDGGRRYVFHLREGLKFHNGKPVTSREVRWSWERYLDPDTRWQCRRWFARSDGDSGSDGKASVITSIDTPDAATVVFQLEEPSTLFLDRLANVQCISAILHPASVDANGEWIKPIGTGPYMFGEWRHGEFIELNRFPDYRPHGEKVDGLTGRKVAYADRVRFVVSPDPAATKAALLARQIDVYSSVPMSSLAELESAHGIRLAQTSTLGWSVLLLQTRDPLLSDVRIRRSIAYAIDREMVSKFNTYGYATVNSSAVPVGSADHTRIHDEWYAPDIGKARKLLREAGYHGQPIRIQANRKYANMYANAVVIQAMLQAAGMNAHIEVLDWAGQLSNYFAGRFQLSAFSFSPLASPALRYIKLIGSKDRRPVYQWDSPRAEALLAQALSSFDPDRQRAIFEDLNRLMVEEVPIIGLYNAHHATALLDTVHGYRPWPLTLPRLWGVWTDAPASGTN